MKQLYDDLEEGILLPHSPVPLEAQRIYARIHIPVVIIDIKAYSLIWANAQGLEFLGKTPLEATNASGVFHLDFPHRLQIQSCEK